MPCPYTNDDEGGRRRGSIREATGRPAVDCPVGDAAATEGEEAACHEQGHHPELGPLGQGGDRGGLAAGKGGTGQEGLEVSVRADAMSGAGPFHCFGLYDPQQRLAFRPLPQGHGSLRPTEWAGVRASGRPQVRARSPK